MELSPVEIALDYPTGGSPRSEGIHLSRVIRSRAIAEKRVKWNDMSDLGLIEVKGEGDTWWDTLDAPSKLRIGIGLAWEQWYIPQLGDVSDHPGEMFLDGIFMTHDGESLDVVMTPDGPKHQLVGHEVKATYKSTKTIGNLHDEWLWLAQMKGYGKGLNTRIWYMHVLFLCGDYMRPIVPQLKCWRVEFTQQEIDEEWEKMLGHVRLHRTLEQV